MFDGWWQQHQRKETRQTRNIRNAPEQRRSRSAHAFCGVWSGRFFIIQTFLKYSTSQQAGNDDSDSGPEVIILFSCSTQPSMKFSLLINMNMPTIEYASYCWHFYIYSQRNVPCSAMPSKKELVIISNLRIISRTNFMLSWVEHEKNFVTISLEATRSKLFCLSSLKEIYSKRKEFTPVGSKFFSFIVDPFL